MKVFNRGLSDGFLAELRSGQFAALLTESLRVGLDVQIRENYLNLYYEDRAVLCLKQSRSSCYRVQTDAKYLNGITLPNELKTNGTDGHVRCFEATDRFVEAYVQSIPAILANAQSSVGEEAKVERAMISASLQRSSPMVFIDRQVVTYGIRAEADLIGITPDGQLVVTEIKQGQEKRIPDLMPKIAQYQSIIAGIDGHPREEVLRSYRKVIEQKQLLGLLPRDVVFPGSGAPVRCLVVLYDYYPDHLLPRLRSRAIACQLPVDLVELPKNTYMLPPMAGWERLCPVQ